jgi:hypothetical protein
MSEISDGVAVSPSLKLAEFIEQNRFDDKFRDGVGYYVYVLRKTHGGEVLYVGKGKGGRVLSHFQAALDGAVDAKSIEIRESFSKSPVDICVDILQYGLSEREALKIECAIIDLLKPKFNKILGYGSHEFGIRPLGKLRQILAAAPINPDRSYETVFLFPVQNALREGRDIYSSTRTSWQASKEMRPGVLAVGLDNGLSKGVFRVSNWSTVVGTKELKEFVGHPADDCADLLDKNWHVVLRKNGYWRRGRYLVVEFDGQGKFRFIRGNRDKSSYFNLADPRS